MSSTQSPNIKGVYMDNLRKRIVFDVLLTALLVFEMLFQLTGDFLHEVVGMVFFVTIVVHLVLSRKWIGVTSRSIAQGKKLKTGNTLRMVMGIALGVTMLVLMASSLAISNVLYGFGINLAGGAYATWVAVHTASSYLLCCLVAGHLAIHWASVAAAFRIPYNRERRAAINAGVTALAALGVAAIGLRGSEAIGSAVEAVGANATAETGPSATSGFAVQDVASPTTVTTGNANATSTRTNKHARSGKGASTSNSGSSANSGSSGSSGSSDSSGSLGSSANSGSSNTSASASTSSSGICTLCRKNCPLSSPKCNKPYAAGLI